MSQAPMDGPVLVNFWATTCAPCRRELPLLQRAARAAPHGLRVVGITRDMFAHYPLEMMQRRGVTYPNYLDPDGDVMADLAALIPVNAVPSSLLLVDGHIVSVHVGPFDSYRQLVDGVRAAARQDR